MERPDLSQVDLQVRAYIEFLEKKLAEVLFEKDTFQQDKVSSEILPSEPPTSVHIITISHNGLVKRTARHHYSRQHRGGMGVFDMELPESDFPRTLVSADDSQTLLFFTNKARVFRLSSSRLDSTPIRSRGQNLISRFTSEQEEKIVAAIPEHAQGYVAIVSTSGRVRCLRHHLFGEHMRQGLPVYHYHEFGPLASVCWSPGDADLFILTKQGVAIRFNEKILPPQGDWGIRLANEDEVVAVTAIHPDDKVVILGVDGKGTARLMSGFTANKSPGGSGKLAMKNTSCLGAIAVSPDDDLFIITRTSKIIRFNSQEIPATEGVVQGVNCIMLRLDEVTALTKSKIN